MATDDDVSPPPELPEPPDAEAAVVDDDADADDAAGPSRTKGQRTIAIRGRTDAVRQVVLNVVAGPDAGASYKARGSRTVIGTHEAADLVLTDPTVSRFHCEILWEDGKVQLRDLGSRNGTVFQGMPVVTGYLPGGAVLTLGHTRIRFELGKESVTVPVSERTRFGGMVGTSLPMRQAFALLERAAASDVTVLLEGETGTGKEAAADAIHGESARKDKPLIVVDCGAIPPDLLESELFGHERGAFTGAVAARKGAFEVAQGGTVFLDEIGELTLDLQPKLLRVLEKREIKRVGSSQYFPVNVRVLAATNRNLREEVNKGRFRSDLYYRLAVMRVPLPALRQRAEDLGLIVAQMVQNLGVGAAEAQLVQTPEFVETLAQHAWPGNVRELRNYLERCMAMRETVPMEAAEGSARATVTDASLPLKTARENVNRRFEREYVEDALRRHGNNVAQASRAAEVGRMYFYRLMWRHGFRQKGAGAGGSGGEGAGFDDSSEE